MSKTHQLSLFQFDGQPAERIVREYEHDVETAKRNEANAKARVARKARRRMTEPEAPAAEVTA